MKLLSIALTFLCFTNFSFAQEKQFVLNNKTSEFPTQFVVLDVDSTSVSELYDGVIKWININYNSPSKVIKSKIEDEYIRIEGVASNLYSYDALGAMFADVKYTIEFAFKESRVKFEVINTDFYITPDRYVTGGWTNIVFKTSKLYRSNGSPKKQKLKSANRVLTYFNDLSSELEIYLNKPADSSSDSDW